MKKHDRLKDLSEAARLIVVARDLLDGAGDADSAAWRLADALLLVTRHTTPGVMGSPGNPTGRGASLCITLKSLAGATA